MNIEQAIRDYLPPIVHMSLGTSKDNKPWVCEVHFAYDEDLNLYFRSLSSRRHSQEIAVNPYVSGNIVKQHSLEEYPRGVYFEGVAVRLEFGSERQKAFICIKERLHTNDNILEEANDPSGHQFYKITVETWYVFGKFDEDGKKYELAWNKGKR
ncbi:MAG TPA: pyridoxamine 5'-phosphate oxidase family protein [Candidatus Saccharimonadia bacterium]|nr:pyridoxamine 5'-phosphate oxidase family protein [Candidatus Saccharimonadia bacterium]